MSSIWGHAERSDEWNRLGFRDYGSFVECVKYVNQRKTGGDSLSGGEWYYGSLSGEWYYGDDQSLTIYSGTFSNDHSAGCSMATYAERFDNQEEYKDALKEWELQPEYI